jgi:DNA-binding XRE family transcriptional regulator
MSPVCGQFENLTNGQHNPLVSFPLCDIKLTTKKPLPRVYPSKEDASLGAYLKRKRLNKGWTRLRASTHLEVSEDTYRNWEWNWCTPELRHMKKVIDFLGFNFWDDGTNSLSNRRLLYRIDHNLTQQELANLIDIGKTTIGRIEN